MRYILLSCLCWMVSVHAGMGNIPKRDLNQIKYFFEGLIESHNFSYTLFGSKPMSLADYKLAIPPPRSPTKWIRSISLYVRAKSSLTTWYRHRHEFNLKDFIFLDEENDWIDNCLVLFLINKKNMLRVLREHEQIFKEELGASFTAESCLEKLEKRELSLAETIKGSRRLMGIMLGYGERNASLFQKRYELMKQPDSSSMLADIETQCGNFSALEPDAIIHPLYFLADPSHPETIALKQLYEQERKHIIALRKQRNFMDLVLQRLVTAE